MCVNVGVGYRHNMYCVSMGAVFVSVLMERVLLCKSLRPNFSKNQLARNLSKVFKLQTKEKALV